MATVKRICPVEGCEKPTINYGYCRAHGARWKRHGDPLAGNASAGEPLRWLIDHVNHDSDECLIWPNGRTGSGRGAVWTGARYVGAHREMCRLAHGETPSPNHEAAHSCGNGHGRCVNPRHLRWATASDNQLDSVGHGTHVGLRHKGERNPIAKLKDAEVIEIRQRLRGGEGVNALARAYGVSQPTISRIKAGLSWQHLLDPA